jgi:predicted nucleic acid-binding Zn ribbon protein
MGWVDPPRASHDGTEPYQIGDALDRVLQGLGAPSVRAVRTVFSSWEELVGPEVAGHCRPVSLDGGVLLVVVDQPAWATRIRFGEQQLLGRVAEELGDGVVRRVEVRVGGP